MDQTYNQTGSYLALAGVIVTVLTHFGIIVDTTSIVSVIAGIVALVGIVKQFISHKNLAKATGKIQ